MKMRYLFIALASVFMAVSTAHAQSTSTGTGTANVSTNANQSTASTNAGVNALVNSYGSNFQRVDAQVPISLSGYGSFSQNSCENSLGVGATTRVFSFIYNMPTPEINCQQIVLSNAWGSESQLANNEGKPIQAEMARATSVWQLCQINEQQKVMCIRKGWIVYDDPDHPDIDKTLPNPHFDEKVAKAAPMLAPVISTEHEKSLADAQAAAGVGLKPTAK